MIHPDIAALGFLLGTWRGRGHGDYPTITAFDYLEEVTISGMPKPVLAYQQRTRHAETEAPLHAESGWLRLPGGVPELTIAQPTGIVEVHAGTLTGQRLSLRSRAVALVPSAEVHAVTEVHRDLEVADEVMTYRLSMAAVGQPLQLHLEARLERVGE